MFSLPLHFGILPTLAPTCGSEFFNHMRTKQNLAKQPKQKIKIGRGTSKPKKIGVKTIKAPRI